MSTVVVPRLDRRIGGGMTRRRYPGRRVGAGSMSSMRDANILARCIGSVEVGVPSRHATSLWIGQPAVTSGARRSR